MAKCKTFTILYLLSALAATLAVGDNVVEDNGVGLSYEELEYIVANWTPQMQKVAANDEGDRLELINMAMANKKIANEALKINPESDPEGYWKYTLSIQAARRTFVVNQFVEGLEVPDMSDLARERYQTEKEKYAFVPERRISSHILFACPPGQCSREDTKLKAQEVLTELRAGADFVEMVHLHSGDPGAEKNDGKFDKWLKYGEPDVSPPYTEGLFAIDEVGNYSELVSSQFGVHIIRLDDIQESYFKPYEEVKAKIIADLETEYRKLSIKNFLGEYNLSDDARIDGRALDKIFSSYK